MALLDIVVAPDPVLSKKAGEVKEVTDKTRKLMDDMLETMYAAPGIGLAAPQVGVSKRIVVIDVDRREDDSEGEPLFLVNPKITYKSEETCTGEEGCLSVPELFADVERSIEVEVEYLDYNGKKQNLRTGGLLAICIQHELDHLEGIMFYEHISSLKRNIILRKLKKLKK